MNQHNKRPASDAEIDFLAYRYCEEHNIPIPPGHLPPHRRIRARRRPSAHSHTHTHTNEETQREETQNQQQAIIPTHPPPRRPARPPPPLPLLRRPACRPFSTPTSGAPTLDAPHIWRHNQNRCSHGAYSPT
jgi:hypothetical protein